MKSERLKQYSKSLRKNQTETEAKMWSLLRAHRFLGYKFKRQVVLGNYIVDFVCIKHRLIIELDGGQHAEQVEYDAKRTAELERMGFKILRFWDNELFLEELGVMDKIFEALTC